MTTDAGASREMAPVLAMDGPSGSGKGTISRLTAERLGWRLLDSGALYRLVALSAARSGMALDDESGLAGLARDLDATFSVAADGGERIVLGGDDVSREIRTESCGNEASRVATISAVREALLNRQRAYRQPPGLVADGRDMGTVVFPDAEVKIFLTASAEERARRRHKQLMEKGIDVSLSRLFSEVAERDRRDQQRSVAPLKPAEDAVVVDTTGLEIPEVVERVMAIVRAAPSLVFPE
jgi:cytidylate kinase